MNLPILNIAGYQFVALNDLDALRTHFLARCQSLELKGTILLSLEGINISLAGTHASIRTFQQQLKEDARFADIQFHETESDVQPFKRLKIKFKKEIITLRQPNANPLQTRAPAIAPAELNRWLNEKRDFILLDTRNEYEYQFGTFKGAMNLHLSDFSEFPKAIEDIDKDKPIVMFCTGGIRCEKAALYMLNQGHHEVYQLDGGILGYFKQVGGDHYDGDCFIFDERVALNCHLKPR